VDPRDDTVIYDQADRVEQPDPTTYIFTLRPGITFHDVEPTRGRTLQASDVAQSIERFRGNAIAPTRVFHSEILDQVEAKEPLTVRVTTKRPYVYTLSYLGDISGGAILPYEYGRDRTSLYAEAAGTGPFQLDTATPPSSARLLRHEGYYRAPIPYFDAMEWQVFSENGAKYDALRHRRVDLVPAGSRQDADAVASGQANIEITAEPSLSSTGFGMRVDRPPFNDPRVRGAIDLALDRDSLVRDIALGDGRILGPINPALGGGYWSLSDDDLRDASGGGSPTDIRLVEAAKLLIASGAANAAFKLQVPNTPALLDLASAIRNQLQRINLIAEIEPLDLLSWFTNFRRGAYEATLITHLPYESADVPLRFYHSRGPDGVANPFGFADGAIDSLVERSWSEENREGRQATIREAQALMTRARPLLPLFTATGYSAAWSNVRNRRPGLLGSLNQYNYEQWLAP
jgi:peptide/nickel transport system substrate-binding protein